MDFDKDGFLDFIMTSGKLSCALAQYLKRLIHKELISFDINIPLLGIDFPTTTTDDHFRANTMHLWQNLGAGHNGTTREVTDVFISVESRSLSGRKVLTVYFYIDHV